MRTAQQENIQDELIELSPGTYAWCQCGKSGNQPLCDGSRDCSCHPLEVTITKPQTIALCSKQPEKTAPTLVLELVEID